MESEVIHTQGVYKAWAWFETNKKQVVGSVAAALVVGLVIWFIIWQRDEKQAEASHALSSVFAAQMTSQRSDDPQGFLKVVKEYPNSGAAVRAELLAAGNLFTEGKYGEAQAQFERFIRDHRDSPFIAEAQLGVASCLDAQGKADQALTAYKQLIERHPSANVIPQAKFSLARLYEAQNKPEQAFKLYEELGKDPYGSIGSEAGMRAEELKQKYPNLAAAAPVMAPAASTVPLKVTPTPTGSASNGGPPKVPATPKK